MDNTSELIESLRLSNFESFGLNGKTLTNAQLAKAIYGIVHWLHMRAYELEDEARNAGLVKP